MKEEMKLQRAAWQDVVNLLTQAERDGAWAAQKIRWTLRVAALLGAEEMRDLARRV